MKRLLITVLLTGCASQGAIKQRAYVVGTSSKIAIDGLYGAWDRQANARISDCVARLPPEDHTKSEYDECVGPFNDSTQEKIVVLLEGVQAAQLGLFIALSQDLSDEEVQRAMRDVVAIVGEMRLFIEGNR